jgi:hypothetical protein
MECTYLQLRNQIVNHGTIKTKALVPPVGKSTGDTRRKENETGQLVKS